MTALLNSVITKGFFDTLIKLADAQTKIAWGESSLGELQGEEGKKTKQAKKKKRFPKYPPGSVCKVESDNCNTFVLEMQLQK